MRAALARRLRAARSKQQAAGRPCSQLQRSSSRSTLEQTGTGGCQLLGQDGCGEMLPVVPAEEDQELVIASKFRRALLPSATFRYA
eukprot:6178236-Pleurochrysis_carterae.AAC.2